MTPHTRTPANAPATGAVRYTHRWSSRPATTAGARVRAGFIDAPDTGPANRASRAITAPTATPASRPFSFEPEDTERITTIRIRVRISSMTNDWPAVPAGKVTPRVGWSGNMARNA